MENENMAANSTVDEAATTAENLATSQNNTDAQAVSATEQDTATAQQNNTVQTATVEPEITQTQVFATRLKESTEKAVSEARAKWEQEHVASDIAVPEVSYTPEEKSSLESNRDARFAALVESGMNEYLALTKANEEMNAKGDALLSGKKATAKAEAEHAAILEKERTKSTTLENENKALKAELEKFKAAEQVKASNTKAAAASTGALGSEPTANHDMTEDEWNKQSYADKVKNVKNGNYYKWRKGW
jgi:hypothetical protein